VPALLSANSLTVLYPGVRALDSAHFELKGGVEGGEIHALMGENGAGKSTLIRVLTGLHTPDSGSLELDGRPFSPRSVHEAEAAGISAVFQEIDLIPTMSIAENLLLGRQPTRLGLVRGHEQRKRAAADLARVGFTLDLSRTVKELPVGLRQMVAIARALDVHARALILDEPTSSLDSAETRSLFTVMRDLRARGTSIVFVSHFLDQVYEISDRITVLRNGATVGTWPTPDLSRSALIEAMTGRTINTSTHEHRAGATPPSQREVGRGGGLRAHNNTPSETDLPRAPLRDSTSTPALTFRNLSRRSSLAPVTVTGSVLAGESLGLAGLLGSGRTELARLIFGADKPDSGEVRAGPTRLRPGSIRDSIARGIAFTPEDRKTQGLILELTVRENIILALQARRGSLRPIPRAEQLRLAAHYIRALNIRTPGPETPVSSLSGGNQQKVLLARWLALQPRVLILDEPTRGVDIGARAEIESLIASLREQGLAIILISSELDEVVRMCDRVMVLRDRACIGELSGDDVNERAILKTIAGEAPARSEVGP